MSIKKGVYHLGDVGLEKSEGGKKGLRCADWRKKKGCVAKLSCGKENPDLLVLATAGEGKRNPGE